jgi:hypothetical protein
LEIDPVQKRSGKFRDVFRDNDSASSDRMELDVTKRGPCGAAHHLHACGKPIGKTGGVRIVPTAKER